MLETEVIKEDDVDTGVDLDTELPTVDLDAVNTVEVFLALSLTEVVRVLVEEEITMTLVLVDCDALVEDCLDTVVDDV